MSNHAFAESIANLKRWEETEGGYPEDIGNALDALIVEARVLTGIRPPYEWLWCTACCCDARECRCEADRREAARDAAADQRVRETIEAL